MNVLFLCLSMLNTENMALRNYSLEGGDIVQGIMTNEAPAKAVISELSSKNQKLDKIVAICSKSVREIKLNLEKRNEKSGETLKELIEKMVEKEEENAKQRRTDTPLHWNLFEGEERKAATTYEIYQEMINCHARNVGPSYSDCIYESINIENNLEDKAISDAVIEAATKITNTDEKVNLYIDYNGGQRYIALMILAVANLMKNRSVRIERIMTMNSNDLTKEIVPIYDRSIESVFDCFDLVSGINEYINYGRITGLSRYFEKSKDKEIKEILDEMKEFSDNLQLCRTDYIMEHKEALLKHLQSYLEREKNRNRGEKFDAYRTFFLYVVEDILVGYKGLLDGEIPQIINWCVDHDFVQQALTFCSEEMPGYFWRCEIFQASPLEKPEYNRFLELVHTAGKDFSGLKRNYRTKHVEGSSKYAYEWMICYLRFSANEKLNDDYKKLFAKEDSSYKRQIFFGPGEGEFRSTKKGLGQFRQFDMSDISLSKGQISRASDSAAPLVWQFRKPNRRVKCKKIPTNRKGILEEIFVVYFLLKEQRNKTNHADDTTEGDVWTYDQICNVLKQMVKVLETI